MSNPDLTSELSALALMVGREAGAMVAARHGELHDVDTKASDLDLVTEIDRASEKLITERLLDARPNDGVIGEEGTGITGTSGVDWVIDPIDGTTSFWYGLPGYSISIAAQVDGVVEAGLVLAPSIDTEFAAARRRGSTRNGLPTHCRDVAGLDKAMVATGFSPEHSRRTRQGAIFAELIPKIRDIRRMGSAALDLAAVGAGQVDAYFEVGLSQWDYAAGVLIAAEAGALTLVEPDLATGRSFVAAASPSIAPAFFALLRELGADRV